MPGQGSGEPSNILNEPESEEVRTQVRQSVRELAAGFPLYPKRHRQPSEVEAMGAD